MKIGLSLICNSIALMALAPGVSAQPASQPIEAKEIAPGLTLVTGGGGNSIVRKTSQGSILVDTKFGKEPVFAALSAVIAASGPVRYVMSTHYHGDHTGNNARFQQQGAKVVAQTGFVRELAHFVPPPYDRAEKPASQPDILFDRERTIRLGGTTVRVYHFAAGHTGSDALVLFPDLKILAMGDEFTAAPLLDYVGGGSIAGWIISLDAALALDWSTAIPGHGAPVTRADVIELRRKLQTFLDRARAAAHAGTTRENLLAAIRTDDLWAINPAFWAAPAQLDGLYAEASR